MPTEQIYPFDGYSAGDPSWGEVFTQSAWYWERSGNRPSGVSGAMVVDSFGDSPRFDVQIVGAGNNSADAGATQVWFGKTQTWTAAEVVVVYRTYVSGNSWNAGDYDVQIYNGVTSVDTIGTITDVGATVTTISFALDVADWGTSFVDIVNAVLYLTPRDNGVDPASSTGDIQIWDMYIEGTYSGAGTLNSAEVPHDFNNISANWNTAKGQGGFWRLFSVFPNKRFDVNVSRDWTSDPDMYAPSAYNTAANWTDHTNGEAATQAFYVLDHVIVGEDNDNYRWMLVTGVGGATDVEALYTSPLGNGDRTDTSANIGTPANWDLHNLEARFDSSAGMADTIQSDVYRFYADVEFPGLLGAAIEISATAEGALDADCFMAGEVLIGGNPTFQIESDANVTLGTGTEWTVAARIEARLDCTSDYVIANGGEGAYLHGTTNVTVLAEALLDGLCGSRVNTKTIDDTTVVKYRLILKDVTTLLSEIELPCKRVGATSRNGSVSRATFVVPDVDTHLPLLNSRLDGTLELRAILTRADGLIENAALIVEINISEIETVREGELSEITVTGSKQRTFGAGKNWLTQAEGNRSEGNISSVDFIETLDDPRVQPGDFIDIRGASQIEIKEIERELNGTGTRIMTLRPV